MPALEADFVRKLKSAELLGLLTHSLTEYYNATTKKEVMALSRKGG